ncbi:hypothetical protein AXG93_1515s1080 [Marchantia polymorpha subsp. ruderalis]|uniref:Uncharacterized protein n=1 Tax=Marchantia polymorpha subsp. ruderalis TaxID=1480154 RepID=A0A176WQF1_MARPO|nr:hypothetical protein AXG93_1515s1080 [Marchantia polymorpha subsp. ruderalis]
MCDTRLRHKENDLVILFAFGGKFLRPNTFGTSAAFVDRFRLRIASAEELQEVRVSIELSAQDLARKWPGPRGGGEARNPPMGMELGVSGDGTQVAAGEEPTSARIPTGSGEMVGLRLGTSVGKTRCPSAHHQLDREQKKNREQYECRGSENGSERRSRVNAKCLLLPPEVGRFTSPLVGQSRKLASLFCRQAVRTPDEPRRDGTRHPRGRMRVHELAEDSGTPCTEGTDAFGGGRKAFEPRKTACGTDKCASDRQVLRL